VTTRNVPRGIQTPRLNSIETWAASDVIGCGRTGRTNKYGHEFLPKYTQDSDCPHGTFQSSTPEKRGLINNGVSKKILPRNRCVLGACVSFLVVSNKVHTRTHPASKTIVGNNWSSGETKNRRTFPCQECCLLGNNSV